VRGRLAVAVAKQALGLRHAAAAREARRLRYRRARQGGGHGTAAAAAAAAWGQPSRHASRRAAVQPAEGACQGGALAAGGPLALRVLQQQERGAGGRREGV
jgi:hypothetical protein